MVKKSESSHKPGSVLGDHLSSPIVTDGIKRQPEQGRAVHCVPLASCTGWGLQQPRVTRGPGELLPRLSILTPFRRKGRFLSVALSLESPPPAVSRHPCPAVPGLSSCLSACDHLSASQGILYFSCPGKSSSGREISTETGPLDFCYFP